MKHWILSGALCAGLMGCATTSSGASGAAAAPSPLAACVEKLSPYLANEGKGEMMMSQSTKARVAAEQFCKDYTQYELDLAMESMDLGLTARINEGMGWATMPKATVRCAFDEHRTKPKGSKFTISKECEAAGR